MVGIRRRAASLKRCATNTASTSAGVFVHFSSTVWKIACEMMKLVQACSCRSVSFPMQTTANQDTQYLVMIRKDRVSFSESLELANHVPPRRYLTAHGLCQYHGLSSSIVISREGCSALPTWSVDLVLYSSEVLQGHAKKAS